MRPMFDRINAFLDKYILPWPVRYLTFRFTIIATIGLLIPLVLFANNTVMVLGINSYLNVMSVAVSSIVLLYATISEVRQKQIAELQERRAQEDHAHITETHEWMMRALANQHEELEDLKALLSSLQGQTYQRKPAPQYPNLRESHPQGAARFEPNYPQQRLARHMKRNSITDGLQQPETPPIASS